MIGYILTFLGFRGPHVHRWRPCLYVGGPAKTCACGFTEQVSTADFYAQFGFMPIAGPAVRDAPGLRR